ncbi:DNA excision repair protein ERCC-6 [Tritrichomonas musculus]|uniref:DNA excision repair protein ERCC-6 n=1 Tax=Tritrichomonas musculus TaxID=1915356 RepID=A0ABR2KS15_9EUKA
MSSNSSNSSSDDDDISTFIGSGSVKRTDQYEANVIDSIKYKAPVDTKKESREDIEKKIDKIKKKLAEATLNGKDKLVKKYQDQLNDEKAKLDVIKMLPNDLGVGLEVGDQGKTEENEPLPEQNDELSKYWHYKVLHTAFAGDDSINLTIDDSDESAFKFRNAFIKDHCEPYTDITKIDNTFSIPTAIWDSLFPHQKVGVKWLFERWKEQKGGIEGDEMGLGKTAIACVFIHSLVLSKQLKKPVLILCPLTVSQQWIRELHIWCPQLRSILLHPTRTNRQISEEHLLDSVKDSPSVVVTNYETLHRLKEKKLLNKFSWGIIICDEGHKIRNHESNITKLVKSIEGDFHLILSGSPIQNSLVEFWSLFDFAVPGLLGTLSVFQKEFAEPIQSGGYGNSNPYLVLRAYSLAVALRDLIKPYLLRRLKKDVKANLPGKSEQILFTNLTPQQVEAYLYFTDSSFCKKVESGKADLFKGIDKLRKICNHPSMAYPEMYLEDLSLSAKLNLLRKILPHWKKNKHRVLIFSHYLKMLDFICTLCDELDLSYFRFDGETAHSKRIQIMDRFNAGENFACIASTEVGGIGVNLIGADRVIIVDPDWNPSTDNQALERAWRIGQKKDVLVYRLITVGTIEEKMYKKQIYKQFLSEKILKDPNQKRLFTPNSKKDLFRLDMEVEKEFLLPIENSKNKSEVHEKNKNKSEVHGKNKNKSEVHEKIKLKKEKHKHLKNFSDYSTDNLDSDDDYSKNDMSETSGSDFEDKNESYAKQMISENDLIDLSDLSDDENETNNEKEMVKNLVTSGDLKHAFPIDELFSESSDNKKITKQKHQIEKEALESLEKLKRSCKEEKEKERINIEIQQKRANETPADKHKRKKTFNNLIRLFISHGGKLSSDQIVNFFNKNPIYSTKEQLKESLKKVSVLNKRTHVWHLKTEYLKLFGD